MQYTHHRRIHIAEHLHQENQNILILCVIKTTRIDEKCNKKISQNFFRDRKLALLDLGYLTCCQDRFKAIKAGLIFLVLSTYFNISFPTWFVYTHHYLISESTTLNLHFMSTLLLVLSDSNNPNPRYK